jgi:hypothetical protein
MTSSSDETTSTLLLVSIVVLSGCLATTPGTPDESEADNGGPHATLLNFDQLTSECLDPTGLGGNTSTYLTDDGARIVLNRTITTTSPNATLNASLSSHDANATTWILHITSRVNRTDASTCPSRVQFHAVIGVPTQTYNITIRYNGNWSGSVFRSQHSGGGGVAFGPIPSNNTTSPTTDSNSAQYVYGTE